MQVSKLNALGCMPILFLAHHDRKNQIIGDMIHHVEPGEGVVQEILSKMRKLYEHLLRSKMLFNMNMVLRYKICFVQLGACVLGSVSLHL